MVFLCLQVLLLNGISDETLVRNKAALQNVDYSNCRLKVLQPDVFSCFISRKFKAILTAFIETTLVLV